MVDWNLALATGRRLVKPGPEISASGAAGVVSSLRDCSVRAEAHVAEVTGLRATSSSAPVLIIDRPGWIQANIDAFAEILAPLAEKLQHGTVKGLHRAEKNGARPATMTTKVGSRVTGVEVGGLLSYLAPKVLGQFDPFYPGSPPEPGGRLLLVAPNIVQVERELGVDVADFRLWVCLHEETHRVQFTAVRWLRNYLRSQIAGIVAGTEFDGAAVAEMMRRATSTIARGIRGQEEISLIDLVQTPAQRADVDRITAIMSLLEGHADVVMDQVGPQVIPSVATIRARFNVRRQGQGFDKIIRRLLGLDAKMRQYRDGAAFCRRVIDQVGMAGLNQVFSSPVTLPSKEEIANAQLWLDRVHGSQPLTTPAGDEPGWRSEL